MLEGKAVGSAVTLDADTPPIRLGRWEQTSELSACGSPPSGLLVQAWQSEDVCFDLVKGTQETPRPLLPAPCLLPDGSVGPERRDRTDPKHS